MNKIFFLLLFSSFFLACRHASESNNIPIASDQKITTAATAVQLDSDHRWAADEATNKNVALLQQQVAERKRRPHHTAGDYQQTAAVLQMGLNQLVKQCTMKGPEHDALHLWLEPLLHDNRALQKVTDTNAGDRLFYSVHTRLLDYNLYFQ